MNLLVFLILVYTIVNMFMGYRKGFLHITLSLVGWILIIVIGILGSPSLATYLEDHTSIDEKISKTAGDTVTDLIVNSALEKAGLSSSDSESQSVMGVDIPDSVTDQLQDAGLGDMDSVTDQLANAGISLDGIGNEISEAKEDDDSDQVVGIGDLGSLGDVVESTIQSTDLYSDVADKFTDIAMKGIAFCILCAIGAILYLLIYHALRSVEDAPGLGEVNKIAGCIVGFIRAIFVVWVAFAALAMNPSTGMSATIIESIESSPFLSILYDNNLVLMVLMNYL